MIRAGALSYAIIFALLIGLLCSGILFINSAQKKIEVWYTGQEHVLLDSYEAIQYGNLNVEPGDSALFIHSSGDSSKIKHLNWGVLTVIASETFHGSLKKKRCAIIGMKQSKDFPALYLPGNSGSLRITGESTLEGNVFIPNKTVESAYLSGKSYTKKRFVFGEIEASELNLPELNETAKNINPVNFTKGLKPVPFKNRALSAPLDSTTVFYRNLEAITVEQNLIGKIIVQSFDSIFVTKNTHLEHVILIAPIVRFESGFKGNAQVIASERITLEKDVVLEYPSVLVMNETELKNTLLTRQISIEENAMVLGGVLVTSQALDYRNPPRLSIGINAVSAGIVYNSGSTEVKGAVIGSLYTSQLHLNYGGGEYSNHLVDATISSERLPKSFVFPNWLKSSEKPASKIIVWI